jgi:hypothetical protein
MQNVPVGNQATLRFMYDQTAAPFIGDVHQLSDSHLIHQLRERESGTCPPRSPDLTSVDFCLWDHLKDKVYWRRSGVLTEAAATVRHMRKADHSTHNK